MLVLASVLTDQSVQVGSCVHTLKHTLPMLMRHVAAHVWGSGPLHGAWRGWGSWAFLDQPLGCPERDKGSGKRHEARATILVLRDAWKAQFRGKQQLDAAGVGVKAMDHVLDLYRVKGGEMALGGAVVRSESERGDVQ